MAYYAIEMLISDSVVVQEVEEAELEIAEGSLLSDWRAEEAAGHDLTASLLLEERMLKLESGGRTPFQVLSSERERL